MHDLQAKLRELPVVEPPPQLQQRILRELPFWHGAAGWLSHYLLRPPAGGPPAIGGQVLLPGNPAEYGLAILSTGVFFLLLQVVALLRLLPILAGDEASGLILTFAPALLGALLLLLAGWLQLCSPWALAVQPVRMVMVLLLFSFSILLGVAFGGQPVISMVGSWLGASGLLVTLGLLLIPRFFSPTQKQERFHAQNICTA